MDNVVSKGLLSPVWPLPSEACNMMFESITVIVTLRPDASAEYPELVGVIDSDPLLPAALKLTATPNPSRAHWSHPEPGW